jgi:hypothetical protein
MTVVDETRSESRAFEADVAKLLQMMVHSVYSDKDVFLRELISNAADACERLRYEAIANPALFEGDPTPRITLTIDADKKCLTVEDNGIGMGRDEMVHALGTIAHSGTKAFLDRVEAAKGQDGANVHRAVWRRLLFGVHGGGPRRRHFPACRDRRGIALVVGRQGHLFGIARGAVRGSQPWDARGASSDGRCHVLR